MINLKKINLPPKPGCYLFKNKTGKVIYIGKARNLKKRVDWYFKEGLVDFKTSQLAREVATVDFIVTSNEVEALLLEAKLIKKYQPKYNLKLLSGERYAYIQITNEEFPRLITTRKIKKGGKYFGPYTSGEARQEAVRLANTLFKLRICRRLPKRACLLYHIKQCSAPCLGKISVKDYQKNIIKIEMMLKGRNQELIEKLEKEMRDYSAKQNYELAKIRRDQILALKNISERQRIQLQKKYNQDVINYFKMPKKLIIQLFNINKGVVSGRKEFRINIKKASLSLGGRGIKGEGEVSSLLPLSSTSSPARREEGEVNILVDFITQYYYTNEIPQEIIVPEELSDQSLLEKYLTKLAGKKVKITVPQKGDKLKLLELVKENLEVSIGRGENDLLELQNFLGLPCLPRIIEAFDISNLGETAVVGSMVQFRDGEPDKNNYRRFKIKTVIGQSDFDCLKEIIYRRYHRLKKEKSPMPDLIMVDGGKPQLSAALSALRELGLQIPVIALAKKFEEIYTVGRVRPLKLSKKSPALKLIQKIRNKAHRFAIKYHRLIRNQELWIRNSELKEQRNRL